MILSTIDTINFNAIFWSVEKINDGWNLISCFWNAKYKVLNEYK